MDEKNLNPIDNEAANNSENATEHFEEAADVQNEAVAFDAVKPEEEIAPEPQAIPQIEAVKANQVIEEQPVPVLEPAQIPRAEPAVYAFRWDYNEQRKYDGTPKAKSKTSKGVLAYAIILTFTFLLAIAVLIGALFYGDYFKHSSSGLPMQYSDELALDALYDYCLPSYVAISVIGNDGTEGAGSGIVITEDGYISTNYHVVENAKKITVITSNGTKHDATFIDGDEVNDIAVIKVSAKRLTPAVIGNSKNTKVGERVIAIGTPYSISYAGTLTSGYVSGIERQYAVMNDNGTVNKILKLIQTDTSVNPGNSGGPLFNMNGEVIGIVVMKIAGGNYEGMGFAIPVDGVIDMIYDIIENGKLTDKNSGSAVQGAALGISGHSIEGGKKYLINSQYCVEVLSDTLGEYITWKIGVSSQKIYLDDTSSLEAVGLEGAYTYEPAFTGVLVKSTSEGFDSNKKLKPDDIIVSANGIPCDTISVLQEIIFDSRIGDALTLEVYRNGNLLFIDVELGMANDMD